MHAPLVFSTMLAPSAPMRPALLPTTRPCTMQANAADDAADKAAGHLALLPHPYRAFYTARLLSRMRERVCLGPGDLVPPGL